MLLAGETFLCQKSHIFSLMDFRVARAQWLEQFLSQRRKLKCENQLNYLVFSLQRSLVQFFLQYHALKMVTLF